MFRLSTGVDFPDREVEFDVKELLYHGKLDMQRFPHLSVQEVYTLRETGTFSRNFTHPSPVFSPTWV